MFRKPKKPTYFEIGKNGTVEEFREANKRALGYRIGSGSIQKYDTGEKQEELRSGALKAFEEGRPENIQTALSDCDEFAIHKGYVALYKNNPEGAYNEIIYALIKGDNDPSAVINLAVLANVAEDKKQGVLNNTLFKVVQRIIDGREVYISALLNAGADANAEAAGGYKGLALAAAVNADQPLSVIEMLHEKGADFDDAIESMQASGWKEEVVTRVKVLREKYTGRPANEEAAEIKALRQEITELREELTGFIARFEGTPASGNKPPEKAEEDSVQEAPQQAAPEQRRYSPITFGGPK